MLSLWIIRILTLPPLLASLVPRNFRRYHTPTIYLPQNNHHTLLGKSLAAARVLGVSVARVPALLIWCHNYDVNYMIMQGNMTMMERVIINGTVESCMAIYLGMAMEMP